MDYGKIIGRAWHLTWRHKFLWGLGILAALTEGSGFNFYSPSFDSGDFFKSEQAPANPDNGTIQELVPRVLGVSTQDAANSFIPWLAQYWPWLVLVLICLLILILGILYISNSAKAGLILSVNTLEAGEKSGLGFGTGYRAGRPFGWRLLGLQIFVGLIILAVLAVFSLPFLFFTLLDISSAALIVLGVIFGLLAILIVIALAVYLSVIMELAGRIIVLKNERILSGFKSGHQLVRQNLGSIVLLWLIRLGLGIAFGLAVFLALLGVGGLLFGLGLLVYLIAGTAGAIIYGFPTGLVFLAILLTAGGFITAFFSGYWTLAYRALMK